MPHLEIQKSVTLEKLRALYQNASLFLLYSNEKARLVIAERGRGVRSSARTAAGRNSRRRGRDGHLTPVGDAEALKRKMQDCSATQGLRERIAEGAPARRRAFFVEAAGKVFLKHYDALLDGSV